MLLPHRRFHPPVCMLTPSLVRLKPPTEPRLMNLATGPSTPPLSSLNPNCVAPKLVYKPPPKGPRALMGSRRGPGNLSSGSSTTSTAAANVSTWPSAPPTSSLPTSITLASPSLPTTAVQYIPRGPSATRDLERWSNTAKELDRLMETRERDRGQDRERECERERDKDRARDKDRDERKR